MQKSFQSLNPLIHKALKDLSEQDEPKFPIYCLVRGYKCDYLFYKKHYFEYKENDCSTCTKQPSKLYRI